jgi:hypothetical protein
MSKTLNHHVNDWEVLERKIRGKASLVNHEFRKEDADTFVRALILNGSIIDETLQNVGFVNFRRVYTQWLEYAIALGPVRLQKECKALFVSITKLEKSSFVGDAKEVYRRFKHDNSDLCQSIGLMLSPVKDWVVGLLMQSDPFCYSVVSQFLNGIGRVNYSSFDYSDQCLNDYLSIEKKNSELDFDPRFLRILNSILKDWLKVHPMNVPDYPRHSSGAVANIGRASLLQKYQNLSWDNLLAYSFGAPEVWTARLLNRTCDVIFVPKTTSSWRTISMEPATLMFYQQSVLTTFMTWFEEHPYLSHIIKLRDDSQNREMARLGSLTQAPRQQNYATIDLSSASDSVTWELVKGIFRGTPILRFLYSTRSQNAKLPSGELIKLYKFAPMGSAVCFPVECIVFALAVEFVQRVYGNRNTKKYSVYGDDIVVHESLADKLVFVLGEMGFSVNHQKTFTRRSQYYRESCGGEFVNGIDVTPLRLPRNFVHKTGINLISDPKAYASGVSFINELYKRKLRIARCLALKPYLQLPKKYRPLFTEDGADGSIITNGPRNHHLDHYPNYELFGISYRHGGIISRDVGDVSLQPHSPSVLYEWLRATRGRLRLTEPNRVPRCRTTTKVVAKLTTLT